MSAAAVPAFVTNLPTALAQALLKAFTFSCALAGLNCMRISDRPDVTPDTIPLRTPAWLADSGLSGALCAAQTLSSLQAGFLKSSLRFSLCGEPASNDSRNVLNTGGFVPFVYFISGPEKVGTMSASTTSWPSMSRASDVATFGPTSTSTLSSWVTSAAAFAAESSSTCKSFASTFSPASSSALALSSSSTFSLASSSALARVSS
mmetsp:Transcript_1494/g.2981  ORF Transcript_1494/g.2981 Transcript_1494/m.2981 type:complete len:205 (+) Transcript_1494:790-1404(+)